MTNYNSYSGLPIVDYEYAKNKRKQLDELINNTTLKEIENEDQFQKTLLIIKNKILLKPVKFDTPKISSHFQTEKDFPATYDYPFPGKRKVFVVTVDINFIGNKELFKYAPNGYSISSSDFPYIFQPSDDKVKIEVEVPNLDNKNSILNEAQRKMNLTYSFVTSNSIYIDNWNKSLEPEIETLLRTHKEKLENLYK